MEFTAKYTSMLETIILLAFCCVVGLISVVIALMQLFPPSAITMDKIVFALISLTIGGFFMFNVAWSFRTGELRALVAQLRKTPAKTEGEVKSEGTHSPSA